jgi:hypothetical protein
MITKPDQLKAFCATGQFKTAAARLLYCMAFFQLTDKKVDAYIEPYFKTFGFVSRHDGSVIEKSRDIYLAADGPKVEEFFAGCSRLHAEHGYTGLKMGFCPALIADHARIKAERSLIDLVAPEFGVTGEQVSRHMEHHKSFVKLVLEMASKLLDSKKAMAIALDDLTQRLTAFESFDALLTAEGAYHPSLKVSDTDCFLLATAYDEAQAARGDNRRAFRYNS